MPAAYLDENQRRTVWPDRQVASLCPYCGVGCQVTYQVKDERIFAYAGRFNWDTVLDILRKHNPGREFIPNFHGGVDANVIKPAARAEDLLRQIGRTGWTSLEESILANTEDLRD